MAKAADKVEVVLEKLRDSTPSFDGSAVVLETASKIDGEVCDASIEVQQDHVPAVAVALLNAEAGDADAGTADAGPVLRCLGAGVVHWLSESSVRLHLQFESGQVLPIEMSKDAALALCRGLFEHTGAAATFEPAEWGLSSAGGTPP